MNFQWNLVLSYLTNCLQKTSLKNKTIFVTHQSNIELVPRHRPQSHDLKVSPDNNP